MLYIIKTIFKKLILIVFLTAVLVSLSTDAFSSPYGIVIADGLRVRKKADIESSHLSTLEKGTRFVIKGYKGNWIRISAGSIKGFISYNERFVKVFDKTEKGKLKRAKVRAKSINSRIETNKKLVQEYKNKEKDIIGVLSDIDKSLNNTRKKLKALKEKYRKIVNQSTAIEIKERELEEEISKIEKYASKRMIAFYKLKRAGTLNFLASADSFYDVIVREKAILRFVKSDLSLFNKRNKDMLKLLNLQNNLVNKKMEIASLRKELEKKEESFRSERNERKRFLYVIRSRKSSRIEAIKELEKAAKALDEKITSLYTDIDVKEKNPDYKDFGFLKGKLEMPVKGEIVSFFGATRSKLYNIVTFKSGIKIKAKRGEPVQAVFGGEIMFASWFKGYGNMLIINHGNHYYTLYAHMEDIFKSKGDKITKGDVIATVGDTGSISGTGLHFEIRHHGKPVDPLKWLKNG